MILNGIRDQWRICSKRAYNFLNRKEQIKALRKRGLDWEHGQPLFSLRPKWLPYVSDAGWLGVERWVDLANRLPTEEVLATLSPEEVTQRLGFVNFGIRNYRMVESEDLIALLRNVRLALEAMATQPRPAGINHFEPDPWILFTTALALADPACVKQCTICNRIFCATRKDQKSCKGSCANTARQRRFREKHYYNQNRKRNRRAREAQRERWHRSIQDTLKGSRK